MTGLVTGVWRLLSGRVRWWVLWAAHAKYVIGVTGVVRDQHGRVLLLRHRMWTPRRPWGLPTGFAASGEEFPHTVVREVKEETGLDVAPGRLVRVVSGFRLRAEVAYEAEFLGGTLQLDPMEILEAGWLSPEELPEGLQESHRALIQGERRASLDPPAA